MRIACIGARATPPDMLALMEKAGARLVQRGHTIVSGNAKGADQAWARGGNAVDPTKVTLCLPWKNHEREAVVPGNVVQIFDSNRLTDRSYLEIAAKHHPRWEACSRGARLLLGRNVSILAQADAVVGWIDAKNPGGGTRAAFHVGNSQFGLPVWEVPDAERMAIFMRAMVKEDDHG